MLLGCGKFYSEDAAAVKIKTRKKKKKRRKRQYLCCMLLTPRFESEFLSWLGGLEWPARRAPAGRLGRAWGKGCAPGTASAAALSGALFGPGRACPTMCWFGKNGSMPIPAAAAGMGAGLDAAASHKWRNSAVRWDLAQRVCLWGLLREEENSSRATSLVFVLLSSHRQTPQLQADTIKLWLF